DGDGAFNDCAPGIGRRCGRQLKQLDTSKRHQLSSLSSDSSKVMPSGSFFSSSLSWAPVAAETLSATSLTGVAGPMPQPSSLPMRFRGEVAGFDNVVRRTLPAPPPKMPPPGCAGGAAGLAGASPPVPGADGMGEAPPPNNPPIPSVPGVGTGGV